MKKKNPVKTGVPEELSVKSGGIGGCSKVLVVHERGTVSLYPLHL